MGYRSQVAIVTKDTVEWPEDVEKALNEIGNVDIGRNTKYFYVSYVKWYEEYADVQLVMKWLETLDDEDYAFLRIGEDSADIEEHGTPWEFNLRWSVRISLGSEDLEE